MLPQRSSGFTSNKYPTISPKIGFGPGRSDIVAIWQSVQGSVPTPQKETDRKIIRIHSMGAGLAP
jgi:hypothetical protein